jgi:hypothetical protein
VLRATGKRNKWFKDSFISDRDFLVTSLCLALASFWVHDSSCEAPIWGGLWNSRGFNDFPDMGGLWYLRRGCPLGLCQAYIRRLSGWVCHWQGDYFLPCTLQILLSQRSTRMFQVMICGCRGTSPNSQSSRRLFVKNECWLSWNMDSGEESAFQVGNRGFGEVGIVCVKTWVWLIQARDTKEQWNETSNGILYAKSVVQVWRA